MSLGIICCQSLEMEIRTIIRDIPEVTHLEIMDWRLHNNPDLLLERVTEKIDLLQNQVDAVLLGYGRCHAMNRLPDHFEVPIFRPEAEDCIEIILGKNRYQEETKRIPGTWFLTRGWIEISMSLISHGLQTDPTVEKFAGNGKASVDLMRRMLMHYTRGLFIVTAVGDTAQLIEKAEKISEEFCLELESTKGSIQMLEDILKKALNVGF